MPSSQMRSKTGAGPELVFLDLDRTLIRGYSISAFALERLLSGHASLGMLCAQLRAIALYTFGRCDYQHLTDVCMAQLAGEDAREFSSFSERVYRRWLRRKIYPEARRLVRRHVAAGRHVVMVTSASRFQAAPIARSLRIDEICCTELEVVDGVLTGQADTCFGVGKLQAATSVANRVNGSLSRSRFYTDSEEDLPLLEKVGRPVAVNPKRGLRRLAAQRDWPILDFPPARLGSVWLLLERRTALSQFWRRAATSFLGRLRNLVLR